MVSTRPFSIFLIMEVQLIENVVPISAIWQSDSVIDIFFFIFFSIMVLSQDTEYSSLHYSVGTCLCKAVFLLLHSLQRTSVMAEMYTIKQVTPTSRPRTRVTFCSIRLEIKCTINVMYLNHPKTITPNPGL